MRMADSSGCAVGYHLGMGWGWRWGYDAGALCEAGLPLGSVAVTSLSRTESFSKGLEENPGRELSWFCSL